MNIGTHQREAEEKLRLAGVAHRGRRWNVEGFLGMKPLEMVVIEGSIEGKRERPSVGQKAEETCLFTSDVINVGSL